jgi:hypothetical protein
MPRGVAICPHPLESTSSLLLISFRYPLGSLDQDKTATTSTMTNRHCLLCHVFLISVHSNKAIACFGESFLLMEIANDENKAND